MITLSGISRFRIDSLVESFSPFTKAKINWQDFEEDQTEKKIDTEFNRDKFFELLKKYFSSNEFSCDPESIYHKKEGHIFLNVFMPLTKYSLHSLHNW